MADYSLNAAALLWRGPPAQITLAVLVSGWAHVLHAMYKPWGAGTVMYALQHGSLFVTSFVFLMVRALACDRRRCGCVGVVCTSSRSSSLFY